MLRLSALRRVLRRDVLTICIVIFTADIMSGILSPTFSLYAKQLGASLTLVGALSSTIGLTKLFVSMPIGMLSDRVGRKVVLAVGMLLFAISTLSFALAPNAYFLFPGRMLSGIAMICTFYLGVAYVGDIVAPEERGLAFGLYSTAMGLGFAIGPLIGAAIAVRYGIAGSYLAAAAAAFSGAVIAAVGLKQVRSSTAAAPAQVRKTSRANTWQLLRNRRLLAGSLGNLLINVSFGGAVANFFPVYAAQIGVVQVAINSMFSMRAFGSTVARLPTGAITSRIPSRLVMYVALITSMTAIFFMSQTNSTVVLSLLLLLEGLSFGTFLTAGQVFTAENSTPTTRGAAVGVYSTAGSVGTMLSSVALGLAADLWGLQMVFRLTAGLLFLGLIVIGYLYMQKEPVALSECVVEQEAIR